MLHHLRLSRFFFSCGYQSNAPAWSKNCEVADLISPTSVVRVWIMTAMYIKLGLILVEKASVLFSVSSFSFIVTALSYEL